MSLINERHWLLCTMNIVLECCVEVAMQASYFGQQTIFGVILHCNFNRSEEHTSELQSHSDLVCRLLLEKKKKKNVRRPVGTAHPRAFHRPARPPTHPPRAQTAQQHRQSTHTSRRHRGPELASTHALTHP